MTIIWNFLLFLFILKLLWNIFTPLAAAFAYQKWKKNGGKKPGNISMASIIEIGILLSMTAMSFIAHFDFMNINPLYTFFIGLGGIILSYGLASILGKFIRRIWFT